MTEASATTSAIDATQPFRNRLCIALDYVDPTDCAAMADRLGPHAGALKVGLQSFAAGGPDVVRRVRERAPVFLDLKLHDIPAQVGRAVESVRDLGASLLTVHASGGEAMLRAAAGAAGEGLTILAVTVLTSLDRSDLEAVGVSAGVPDQVLRLADLALASGVTGLVCSPLEVAGLRSRFGALASGGPLLVVPGIRPTGSDPGDQRRTLAPAEAVAAGADVLVVGRPITEAPDPEAAAAALAADVA